MFMRDKYSTLDVTLRIETFLVVVPHMLTSVDSIGLTCLNFLERLYDVVVYDSRQRKKTSR